MLILCKKFFFYKIINNMINNIKQNNVNEIYSASIFYKIYINSTSKQYYWSINKLTHYIIINSAKKKRDTLDKEETANQSIYIVWKISFIASLPRGASNKKRKKEKKNLQSKKTRAIIKALRCKYVREEPVCSTTRKSPPYRYKIRDTYWWW